MSETLYRKYRPLSFTDIVGQRHIRVTLEQALKNERVAHAYLFTGPRGVGKTTTARILARAMNCLKPIDGVEPCNTCTNCQAILQGRAMDMMEIDAASQTGVDNVRENIIQSARAFPSLLKMKVFIIDEVHMLSLAAFNALLKLIEEPPAHAMFILATTEVHRVPETIISRTQRFDFQRVGLDDTIRRLNHIATREHRRLATGVAERIARTSGGSLRDAESVLGQVFAFTDAEVSAELLDIVLPRSDHGVVLSVLAAVVPGRAAEAIQIFHKFVADGGDITTFIRDLLSVTRNALLLSVDRSSAPDVAKNEDADSLERLQEIVTVGSPARFVRILESFSVALRQVATAAIEELPVEIAIVSVCDDGPRSEPPTVSPPTPTKTPPPTKTEPPPPSKLTPTKKGQKAMSLADATAAWDALRSSSDLPPGLALSVKQAVVTGAEGQTIVLAVPYTLHADRLNSAKNADLIRTTLGPTLGEVALRVAVDSSMIQTDLPPRIVEVPAKSMMPVALTPQPVPVTSGNDLWDTLVSSLGADSTNG